MNLEARSVGDMLRAWRKWRRLSQLDLALEADVSARHLSFVETGRARPSRELALHLGASLNMPLRERNRLLIAAGYAPVFPMRSLDDPTLAPARKAVELVLSGHEPSPALAVDRHWNLVAANRAVAPLIAGADAALLGEPINVLRLSLHPEGLAPRIGNLAEWRGHLLARLRRQIDVSADAVLSDLHDELSAYPVPRGAGAPPAAALKRGGVVAPLVLESEAGTLSLFTTTTVFGTPIDVTLAELAIEALFPADEATAGRLRALCPAPR